jgi:hypothetical protein
MHTIFCHATPQPVIGEQGCPALHFQAFVKNSSTFGEAKGIAQAKVILPTSTTSMSPYLLY